MDKGPNDPDGLDASGVPIVDNDPDPYSDECYYIPYATLSSSDDDDYRASMTAEELERLDNDAIDNYDPTDYDGFDDGFGFAANYGDFRDLSGFDGFAEDHSGLGEEMDDGDDDYEGHEDFTEETDYGDHDYEGYEDEWSDYSFPEGDGFEGHETGEPVLPGKLVERLKMDEERGGEDNDVHDNLGGSTDTHGIRVTLPDEVIASILARVPFSSLWRFRSVCKKWNSLTVVEGATLRTARGLHAVPFCVLYIGNQRFASCNPSSRSWHLLPASFSAAFFKSGLYGEQTKLVAASGGLLVLESIDRELRVVNALNKSERRLPPPYSVGDEPHGECKQYVHLHLDEARSSFTVLWFTELMLYEEPYEGCESNRFLFHHMGMKMNIYDPETDSWGICVNGLKNFSQIVSTVELNGDICCLYCNDWGHWHACLLKLKSTDQNRANGPIRRIFETVELPLPPRGLRAAKVFVRHGNFMLGGLLKCTSRDGRNKSHSAHIWKLVYDGRSSGKWHEAARMPVELRDDLCWRSPLYKPYVVVQGDYMLVTIDINFDERVLSNVSCGIMCHLPSNTWWKLPKWNVEILPMEDGKSRIICKPFLFEPRMDLLV